MLNRQKTSLLSLLEGNKKADELILKEKNKILARMTVEDSLREYVSHKSINQKHTSNMMLT